MRFTEDKKLSFNVRRGATGILILLTLFVVNSSTARAVKGANDGSETNTFTAHYLTAAAVQTPTPSQTATPSPSP